MQENSRNYGLVFFFSLMLYSFNLMRIHKIESDSFPDSFFSGYGAAPLLNLVSSRKSLFPFLTSVRFRKKALKRSIAGVQAIKLISITNFLKKLVYLDKNNKKSFNYKMRSYRIFRKLRAAWFNKKKKYKVRFIARARRRRDNALNTILVNFLKHYRRQLRVIRKSTVNHPIFYYMKPRIKRFSQKVWFLYKSTRRYKKKLQRKKYSLKRRFRYYKSKKFYPRLNEWVETFPDRSVYLMRSTTADTIISIQTKLRKLSYKYPRIRQLLSNRGGLFALVQKATSIHLVNQSKKKISCLKLLRKRSNFYLTIINGLGEVLLTQSMGEYLMSLKEEKRNRRIRASLRYFVEFFKKFAWLAKKAGLRRLHYFFKPLGFRNRFTAMLAYSLIDRGITIKNVVKTTTFRHGKKTKNPKIRRL